MPQHRRYGALLVALNRCSACNLRRHPQRRRGRSCDPPLSGARVGVALISGIRNHVRVYAKREPDPVRFPVQLCGGRCARRPCATRDDSGPWIESSTTHLSAPKHPGGAWQRRGLRSSYARNSPAMLAAWTLEPAVDPSNPHYLRLSSKSIAGANSSSEWSLHRSCRPGRHHTRPGFGAHRGSVKGNRVRHMAYAHDSRVTPASPGKLGVTKGVIDAV
jgi:hypothetical protein